MFFDSNGIVEQIKKLVHGEENLEGITKDEENLAKEIYLSILDVSFTRCGGCIAVVSKEHVDAVKKMLKSNIENIGDEGRKKREIIDGLLFCSNNKRHSFTSIDRNLRLELLGLDGATIIDDSGDFICAGEIVKVTGGSEGGGRTAAAKELAQYGFAVKISEDGKITAFCRINGKIEEGNKVKPIFEI